MKVSCIDNSNSNMSENRTSTHPTTTWLFRAIVGNNTAANNWTELIPTVQQTGLGDFCEPTVTVPSTFAGSKGVVNVVADGPDGMRTPSNQVPHAQFNISLTNHISSFRSPLSMCCRILRYRSCNCHPNRL